MSCADGTWHYYGIWRSPSAMLQEQRPLTGIFMAGWVRARGTAWAVTAEQVEVDLLVSRPELMFLSECAKDFMCWARGLVVMTKHTKMMVPDDFSVYSVSANAHPAPGPLPTPQLGKMLAENARTWELRQTWTDIISKENFRARRVVHPLAMLQHPTEPLPDVPEAYIGHVFASHVQAEVTSGSSKFFGGSASRLGNSGYVYDHARGSCKEADESCALINVTVAKGGVVVADTGRSLMLLAAGCCHLCTENARCLVVAPREALPPLLSALGSRAPEVVCCEREVTQLQSLPRLLVATAEVARKSQVIIQEHWNRVVVCDWMRVLKVLGNTQRSEEKTLFSCETQIALILADRVDADFSQFISETGLGLLLGVAPLQLGCPGATKDLLCERTLRVEDVVMQERSRVCHYSTFRLDAPSNEEKEDASHKSGYESTLAALLGPLCTAGRSSVARLPKGMTLEEFFLRSGSELSDFARGSFREQERCSAICMRESGVTAVTRCGHWFCTRCIARVLVSGSQQCPVCRRALSQPPQAAVQVAGLESTTYLAALSQLLRDHRSAGKRLVVTSFGNCLERVARFLRNNGACAVAWSGNARQLIRNLEAFAATPNGILLCDPEFLPVHLINELSEVSSVLCLLPLNVEKREVCCQLRAILLGALHARLSFVCCRDETRLPLEKPDCGCSCGDCPFLIQNQAF